jgi:hypothetical protein
MLVASNEIELDSLQYGFTSGYKKAISSSARFEMHKVSQRSSIIFSPCVSPALRSQSYSWMLEGGRQMLERGLHSHFAASTLRWLGQFPCFRVEARTIYRSMIHRRHMEDVRQLQSNAPTFAGSVCLARDLDGC